MKYPPITNEDIERFHTFIRDQLPAIDQLKQKLDKDGQRLDFSKESLHFLDDLIYGKVKRHTSYKIEDLQKEKITSEEAWYIVRAAYYLAEIVIRNLNAHWNLHKEHTAQYKKATLKIDGTSFEVDPLTLALSTGKNGYSMYDWYVRMEEQYLKRNQ